jgi:hypothetical protein
MQRAYQAQNSLLAIMQLQFWLELLGFVLRKARFAG